MTAELIAGLPERLLDEDGGAFGFVCIWRPDDTGDSARRCSVREWLLRPENAGGEWLIDGGWGAPPGAIKVRWVDGRWVNAGFPPHT